MTTADLPPGAEVPEVAAYRETAAYFRTVQDSNCDALADYADAAIAALCERLDAAYTTMSLCSGPCHGQAGDEYQKRWHGALEQAEARVAALEGELQGAEAGRKEAVAWMLKAEAAMTEMNLRGRPDVGLRTTGPGDDAPVDSPPAPDSAAHPGAEEGT